MERSAERTLGIASPSAATKGVGVKIHHLAAVSMAVLAAVNCGRIEVSTDYDKPVDVSGYHTFFVLTGNSSGNPSIDQRIKTDVESALDDRGWLEVPPNESEAVIVTHAATSTKHSYDTFYAGWGGWHWHGTDSTMPFVEDNAAGTLVVDIFDARTKHIIWRGAAADAVSDNPARKADHTHDVVQRMFKTLPAVLGAVPAATNATPLIIFAQSPAIVIRIDGEPVYRDVEGTGFQRIVNTRSFIVRDEVGMHFLKVFDAWMEAYTLDGLWSVSGIESDALTRALAQCVQENLIDVLDGGSRREPSDPPSLAKPPLPSVYVSTTPAELIVTQGEPHFVPIEGTALLRLENTTGRVFREPTDEELYVLISSRWFRAWTFDGPWEQLPKEELPADFEKIPDGLLTRASFTAPNSS
jgi:hypothetical protein